MPLRVAPERHLSQLKKEYNMTKAEFEKLSDEEMNSVLIGLLFRLGLVKEEEAEHTQTA